MSEDLDKRLKYYSEELYSNTRNQQEIDLSYYNDTFEVSWIKPPLQVSRVGAGKKIVDRPVHQITASDIVCYRDGKNTEKSKERASDITSMINKVWVPRIRQINPDPVHQFVKDQFIYGEAWYQVLHNSRWVNKETKEGLPFHIISRNPLTVFASPNEDEKGVPEEVFVYYDRMPWIVKALYPAWTDPKERFGREGGTVRWMEHWTKKERYFEADGEKVLPNKNNPYEFVPFVHKIAGFGNTSKAGNMEELIVGYLRQHRDLINRLTSSTSDIDSAIHLYANYSITVQPEQEHIEIPDDFDDKFTIGPGNLHKLPYGIKVDKMVDALPPPEVLTWNYKLQADLGMEVPPALLGLPAGSSGRMQDMTYSQAMKFFAVQVRNTEFALATVFGMALRMCEEVPNLYPEELKTGDIDKNYEVVIKLQGDDPTEQDRMRTMGSRLYQMGQIDLKTNLTKYQGYTDEDAEDIMENILVDNVMRNNPIIAQIMGQHIAQRMGALQEYNQALVGGASPMGAGTPQFGSQGGQPREGNIQTPIGQEMSDVSLVQGGARRSPTG